MGFDMMAVEVIESRVMCIKPQPYQVWSWLVTLLDKTFNNVLIQCVFICLNFVFYYLATVLLLIFFFFLETRSAEVK